MKKYLSALALGSLLCSASIAYGIEKPVIDQINQPALEIQTQNTDQVITKAEFTAMLKQSAGFNINILVDEEFSADEPINFAEALAMCATVANPFEDGNLDTIDLAYEFNLIDGDGDVFDNDTLLTPQNAEKMLNNLTTILNLKQNEKNDQGVSYALTPLEEGYKLELMWGKKPSSGYNLQIEDTKTVGNTLYVYYVTSEPKPGSAYLTVITYPTDSVVLEANRLPKKVVIINNN